LGSPEMVERGALLRSLLRSLADTALTILFQAYDRRGLRQAASTHDCESFSKTVGFPEKIEPSKQSMVLNKTSWLSQVSLRVQGTTSRRGPRVTRLNGIASCTVVFPSSPADKCNQANRMHKA
jgi:hypothetical protein